MSAATVSLNGREVTLAWTNRAQFRLGTLASVPSLKGHQFYTGICSLVWAMLPKELHALYSSPDDLCDHIKIEDCPVFLDAIVAAQEAASAGEEGSAKNYSSGKGRKSASKRK